MIPFDYKIDGPGTAFKWICTCLIVCVSYLFSTQNVQSTLTAITLKGLTIDIGHRI